MRTKILKISCFLFILAATISCDKNEVSLSKDIEFKNRSIVFDVAPASKSATSISGKGEEILFEGVINVNIAQTLQDNGFSFDFLKSFLLTNAVIEEEVSTGFDFQGFIGAKIYFGDMNNLVARIDKVEGSKVRFTIVNGELIDQLKKDELYVIFTGTRPSVPLRLKLTTDYVAKIGL